MALFGKNKELEDKVRSFEEEILKLEAERDGWKALADTYMRIHCYSAENPDRQLVQAINIIKEDFMCDDVHLVFMDLEATRHTKSYRDLKLTMRWSTNPNLQSGTEIPLTGIHMPDSYDPSADFRKVLIEDFMPKMIARIYSQGEAFMYCDLKANGEVKRQSFANLRDARIDLHEFDKTERGTPGDGIISLVGVLLKSGRKVKKSDRELESGEHAEAEVPRFVPEGILILEGVKRYHTLQLGASLYGIADALGNILEDSYEHIDPVTGLVNEQYFSARIDEIVANAAEGRGSAGYLTIVKLDHPKKHTQQTRRLFAGMKSSGIGLLEGYMYRRLGQVVHEAAHKHDDVGLAGIMDKEFGTDTILVYTRNRPIDMVPEIQRNFIDIPFASERTGTHMSPEEAKETLLNEATLSQITFQVDDGWRAHTKEKLGILGQYMDQKKNLMLKAVRLQGNKEEIMAYEGGEGVPYRK